MNKNYIILSLGARLFFLGIIISLLDVIASILVNRRLKCQQPLTGRFLVAASKKINFYSLIFGRLEQQFVESSRLFVRR